jgi:SagB-type dehydrogenase family enzyme
MPQIPLPASMTLTMPLSEALAKRESLTTMPPKKLLSLQDCGTLLGSALQKHSHANKRAYPSGGSLYPIETYLITSALEGLPAAAFHYNPIRHCLETLSFLSEDIRVDDLARHDNNLDLEFTSLIVLTSIWERSSNKYGDFAYMLALIEAGHAAENILLVATALGLDARPLMGFHDQSIAQILDIDPEEEQAVYSIALW